MEFIISKPKLAKSVSNVSGVVERRNTIPVLQNIKIDASQKSVSLLATDMDISVASNVEADVKEAGSTTVNAQLFYDIIRKIPDSSDVTISSASNGSFLKIKSGKSDYTLPCIDASEFPNLAEVEDAKEFSIDSETLLKMIDRTKFAISNDETRYYINGMYLQSIKKGEGNELRSVATDGHRLTMSFSSVPGLDFEFGVIIPKKTVSEIRRLLDGSNLVKISISRLRIMVQVGSITIVSKLIDGQFPDYEKVLPKNNDKIASMSKKLISECVDRISTVANDKHRSVKFVVENSKMTLQVTTSDGGFAQEELEVQYPNEKIETGFNSRYFLDIVSQIDVDEFMMKFKDGISPVIVESEGMDSVFVLMPVRV